MTTSGSPPIGVLGLGLMGSALTRRLVAAGFAVLGYDIDPAKRERFGAIGGAAGDSVAEIGRRCRRILLAVFDTDQVEQVTEGEGGLLGAMAELPGRRLVLCTSTCEPERVAALAARCAPRGLTLLDAPVSGTSDQLLRGDGVGLIGGERAAMDEATDLLDAIYPRRFFIGPAGDAGKAKLAINLILGLNRLALAEGLVFAERLGLDTGAFLGVARASAAYSQIMDVKGDKMLRRDYQAQGRIVQTRKDVQLMLDEAARIGQRLPLAEVHADVLDACLRAGEGDRDNCAVIEEIRRRSREETE